MGSPEPSVQLPAMIVPEGTPAARRLGRYIRDGGAPQPRPRHYHAKEGYGKSLVEPLEARATASPS